MIIYDGPGNILDAPEQTRVCTVNTVGVMGKGVALAFKHRYPGLLEAYQRELDRRRGHLDLFTMLWQPHGENQNVLLLTTKKHWRDPSNMQHVHDNLAQLRRLQEYFEIESLAMPPPGCGNGGLDWETQVKPIVYGLFDSSANKLPVAIYHG